MLKSYSHAHSSEKVDISPRSDGDKDDITDTSCRQQTDNTHCQPTMPVVHSLTGSPTGLQQSSMIHMPKITAQLKI